MLTVLKHRKRCSALLTENKCKLKSAFLADGQKCKKCKKCRPATTLPLQYSTSLYYSYKEK